MWVKNIVDFEKFCFLNIPCLRIIITLIFMSSSSEELTPISRKTEKQMFLLWSDDGNIGVPFVAFPYKAL